MECHFLMTSALCLQLKRTKVILLTYVLVLMAELRDFWLSLPQLNDPSGLNQMAKECDHLVKHLSTK